MQKAPLKTPASPFDPFLVHDLYLARRAAKTDKSGF
jgi:hypothetical protein